VSTHDIDDFLTESQWEGTASNLNVYGLERNETYYVRAVALTGDFTQSGPGTADSVTTADIALTFDIDIDGTGGSSSETSAPYQVSLGTLIPDTVATSDDLIWFDIDMNAPGGGLVFVTDENTGLTLDVGGYTIASADDNLADGGVAEGFGLVEFSSTETSGGPLTVESAFGNGGDIVGGISTTTIKIYNTSASPVSGGRGSLYVKAKIDSSTPAGSYTDNITLVVIGLY
jgi:hypothetical protein